MRLRYCAYVRHDSDYLLRTWHHSTRPQTLDFSNDTTEWSGLAIIRSEAGGADDNEGVVEFVASYRQGGRSGKLHEVSRFVREAGRWFYRDGEIRVSGEERKIGRNDPCPCGSGKKFKRCCGA